MSSTRGYIYILINTSYPGLLKIGKSKRSPEIRANELSLATGVPNSFHVGYYLIVSDIDSAEINIHKHLTQYRESQNREFFRLPLNQAIDLVRKVLIKLNIDFANHEDETYKFRYEEYTSPKDFFEAILVDEDKWEHAKLHLEKGYLVPWLKKKGEIDAFINLDKNSNTKKFNSLNYQLSLICFSIIDVPFIFYSIEIKELHDLIYLINHPDIGENEKIAIWSKWKLYYKYLGYLEAYGKKQNDIFYVIHFVIYYYNKFPKPKLKYIEKVIKWNINPDNFYKLNKLDETNFKYLIYEQSNTVNELDINLNEIHLPSKISRYYAFGTRDEKETYVLIDFITEYKKISNNKGYDFNSNQKLREFLKINSFVPINLNPYYIFSFEGEECFTVLKSLFTKDEINKINISYKLPDGLYSSLINPGNHESFLLASVLLRLLVSEYSDYMHLYYQKKEDYEGLHIYSAIRYFSARTPSVLNELSEYNKKIDEANGIINQRTLIKKYPWIGLKIPIHIWINSANTGENLLHSLENYEK